jgi:hypothetical protein
VFERVRIVDQLEARLLWSPRRRNGEPVVPVVVLVSDDGVEDCRLPYVLLGKRVDGCAKEVGIRPVDLDTRFDIVRGAIGVRDPADYRRCDQPGEPEGLRNFPGGGLASHGGLRGVRRVDAGLRDHPNASRQEERLFARMRTAGYWRLSNCEDRSAA